MAELQRQHVNAAQLVADLEKFFSERAYLPEGAGLLLACFTLNTYMFEVFDTTPYICLESAVPGCGKSTVLRLLEAGCPRAHIATSLTETALFRVIDGDKPVLLIDEAKGLESGSEAERFSRPSCMKAIRSADRSHAAKETSILSAGLTFIVLR